MTTFIDREFKSYVEFELAFEDYKKQNFVSFRKKSSETVDKANAKSKAKIHGEFVYSRVQFICTHYGQPNYRGNGIKSRTKHSATGCEASFTLKYNYYEKVLQITKSHMSHNHPTTPDTFSQEYQVKRLTKSQRETLQEIVDLNPCNENLMRMLNSKYQKAYTLTEVRALKHKLLSGRSADDMADLLTNLEDLNNHGHVKVVVSNNGSGNVLDIVAFASHHMVELFHKYPEVIYMDGTYKNNKSGYPLYQIMVEDSSGKGRTVFYAFVRQENADILSSMVKIFVDLMGDGVGKITHAMTDKDVNEINAIKSNMPHVVSMLCAFHVHKAMKAKIQKIQCCKDVRDRLQQLAYVLVTTNDIATFNGQLRRIEELSVEFFDYLNSNWLNQKEAWAYHARLHSRLLFNDTNNKCEGENRGLKEILNSNTTLPVAVKLLFQHSLTQQFEVSTASVVQATSSTIFRDANPRWQQLYSLFTAYAVQLMIQDHASSPTDVVVDGDGLKCKDLSGVVYGVAGRPLSCRCPFFCQTSLPCCHIMAVFSADMNVVQRDLFDPSNRWLKTNVVEPVNPPIIPPVDVRTLVGPEARHHRAEAVLGRLSCLLKLCGSAQFVERVELVEKVVNAWEAGRECVALVSGEVIDSGSGNVVFGGDGIVGEGSGHVVVGEGSADVAVGDGSGDVAVEGSADVVVGEGSADVAVGEGSGDVVVEGSADVVVGEGSGDVVVGDGSADVVVGEGSGDVVVGEDSGDVVVGEGSADVVVGEGSGDVVVGEGSGDVVVGEGSDDVVVGEGSADVVVGEGSADVVVGEGSADVVVGEASGHVVVEGSADVNSFQLSELKRLNIQVPVVRKRGRPKQLKTRSYKKSKKVKFCTDMLCLFSRGSAQRVL